MTAFRAIAFAIGLSLYPVALLAQSDVPRITVEGQGEVLIAPDMARITLGVTHEAETASDAMAARRACMSTLSQTFNASSSAVI